MKLSRQHLDRFVEQGYVVVEGALSDADLQPVIDDYASIVDGIAQRLRAEGRISQLYANEPFDMRLARICDEDSATYFESDASLDIGRTRTRGLFEIMRNPKTDRLGRGLHRSRDRVQRHLPRTRQAPVGRSRAPTSPPGIRTRSSPRRRRAIVLTVWFPLNEATADNGCLLDSQPPCEPVTVPMHKGDVIFIHKLCPHGSGPNRTDGIRWSLRYQTRGTPSPRPECPEPATPAAPHGTRALQAPVLPPSSDVPLDGGFGVPVR